MRDIDPTTVQAVMEHWTAADIDERLRLALGVLEAMTKNPDALEGRLRLALESGLDRGALDDVAAIGLHFNQINRVADAVDFPSIPQGAQTRTGRLLDRAGALLGGTQAKIELTSDADGLVRPAPVNEARNQMLTSTGTTSPDIRRAIEAHTARALGAERDAPAVPEELAGFLDKLARYAYRITDEDVEALRAHGYEDHALQEIILVGSMGAAFAQLERFYAVLGRIQAPATAA